MAGGLEVLAHLIEDLPDDVVAHAHTRSGLGREEGVELVFAPDVEDMYPPGFATSIDPGPLGAELEGALRPGHFAGMLTVVNKLLAIVVPDVVFFGEKDYQQLTLVRRMVRDLDIDVHVVGVPTVREEDGLALSSRNVYLDDDARRAAVAISVSVSLAIRVRKAARMPALVLSRTAMMKGMPWRAM